MGIGFTRVSEPMSHFELEDGVTMDVRIVAKALNKVPSPQLEYQVEFTLETRRRFPGQGDSNSPPPGKKYPQEELDASITNPNVKFKSTLRSSEYLVDDGTRVKLHLEVSRICKTSKLGTDGKPIYFFGKAGVRSEFVSSPLSGAI